MPNSLEIYGTLTVQQALNLNASHREKTDFSIIGTGGH